MSMPALDRLLDHLAWADAQARDALDAMPPGTPERARAEAIYAHVAAVEHVWVARLEGRAPEHGGWPALPLDDAAALATSAVEALRRHVAALSADELMREITYRSSSGREERTRIIDALLHVALHGAHHRGQLAMLARQTGAAPAVTDYIPYLRERTATSAATEDLARERRTRAPGRPG